jgi:hypothetical protein
LIDTGERLLEVAAELLRQETIPELRTRLERLAKDVDWEGTEEEKNRALAPLDKIPEEFVEQPAPGVPPTPTLEDEMGPPPEAADISTPRSGEAEPIREGHKQESGRRAARNEDERDF